MRTVEINNATVLGVTQNGIWVGYPHEYEPSVIALFTKCSTQHNGYCYFKFGVPRKPRTTGERSQNTHIHGHATELADEAGDTKDYYLLRAKERAISKGYPYHVDAFGKCCPESETGLDTVQAAALIDQLHEDAAFLGVTLKEYEDET